MANFGRYLNRLPADTKPEMARALSDVFRDLVADVEASKFAYGYVTPYDFNAIAGTTADQATAMQNAINAAVAKGVPLDLCGQTWRVDSTLTLSSNCEIRNGTLNFSNAASGDVLLEASGSTGTQNNLTANRSRLSFSLPLTTASGVAGDYFFVSSGATFETNTSTKVGEIVRVLSVSGSTLNLRDATHSAYNTADTAYVKKLTFAENIRLKNIKCIGGGNATTAGGKDQYAARFIVCRNVQVIDCEFDLFDYAAVEFAGCWDVVVRGGSYSRAYDTVDGASYGVMITQGTHHARIEGATFYDQRHGVTTGGTNAVNRYITVTGCTFIGCRAAAIDNHAGSELFAWTGNTISAEVGNLASGTQAALQSLGGSGTISGNVIRGAYEHGILVQLFPKDIQPQITITGNALEHGASADADHIGIMVEQRNNTTGTGLTITGNTLSDGWQTGILVQPTGASMLHVTISNNSLGLVKSRGIYVNVPTGKVLEHGAITGNTVRGDSGSSECIYLNSVDAAGIEYLTVTGNQTYGGTYGIRGVNTERIAVVGNVATAAGTTNITVAGANTTTANNVTT